MFKNTLAVLTGESVRPIGELSFAAMAAATTQNLLAQVPNVQTGPIIDSFTTATTGALQLLATDPMVFHPTSGRSPIWQELPQEGIEEGDYVDLAVTPIFHPNLAGISPFIDGLDSSLLNGEATFSSLVQNIRVGVFMAARREENGDFNLSLQIAMLSPLEPGCRTGLRGKPSPGKVLTQLGLQRGMRQDGTSETLKIKGYQGMVSPDHEQFKLHRAYLFLERPMVEGKDLFVSHIGFSPSRAAYLTIMQARLAPIVKLLMAQQTDTSI